jgi:hypothetical protein
MTVADARVKVTLPDHPKTKKLIRKCGQAGAWNLIRLFLFAASNRPDGDLSGMDTDDLEIAADWQGDPGAFVAALVEVRFLSGADGEYVIHDWAEHNPWASGSNARAEKSRWAALCKQHGRQKAAEMMPEYAESLRPASEPDATRVPESASGTPLARSGSAPSPSPSPLPIQEQEQRRKGRAAPVELPEWLSADAWGAWHRFRNGRKGWTADAQALSLRSLATLRGQGHDPQAVIEQSIERGWTGLFPLRDSAHENRSAGGGKLSAVEQVRAAIDARANRDAIDAGFTRIDRTAVAPNG